MFKTGVLIITISTLGFMYWIGLSTNHIVILSIFAFSILFGALIITDTDEKKEHIYEETGKPAKSKK